MFLVVDNVSSTMRQWLSTLVPLICTVLQLVAGSDESNDVEHSLWQPSYVVSLVSICSIVCIVIVLMACTKWCPRETAEFKVIFVVFLNCILVIHISLTVNLLGLT